MVAAAVTDSQIQAFNSEEIHINFYLFKCGFQRADDIQDFVDLG
jgi:hypothetical protein